MEEKEMRRKRKYPSLRVAQHPSFIMAKRIMNNLDKDYMKNSFWIVSIISSLNTADPTMNLSGLMNIIETEMPKGFDEYLYLIRHE